MREAASRHKVRTGNASSTPRRPVSGAFADIRSGIQRGSPGSATSSRLPQGAKLRVCQQFAGNSSGFGPRTGSRLHFRWPWIATGRIGIEVRRIQGVYLPALPMPGRDSQRRPAVMRPGRLLDQLRPIVPGASHVVPRRPARHAFRRERSQNRFAIFGRPEPARPIVLSQHDRHAVVDRRARRVRLRGRDREGFETRHIVGSVFRVPPFPRACKREGLLKGRGDELGLFFAVGGTNRRPSP